MKFLFFVIGLFSFTIYSQQIEDGLRFSNFRTQGTARYQSMGGAFGALGGDISAFSDNPAGSSVFLNPEMSFTFSLLDYSNENIYFNSVKNTQDTHLGVNQGGLVLILNSSEEDFDKFTLGVNIQRESSLKNIVSINGASSKGIDSFFLNYANGLSLNTIDPINNASVSQVYENLGNSIYGYEAQQAFLGYNSSIINPVSTSGNNIAYTSNAEYTNLNHNYSKVEKGSISRVVLNGSTLFRGFLYLGINVNFFTIRYDETNYLNESGFNTNSNLQSVYFENTLRTNGDGVSVQLGALAKITKNLRAGITYHSPVWFEVIEETEQSVITSYLDTDMDLNEIEINPDIINVYPAYQIISPSETSFSLAYIFQKKGLISVDFSTKDFSNIKFRDINLNDTFFDELNTKTKELYKRIYNLEIGGEFRATKKVSVRGGYAIRENPIKNINSNDRIISFGLGYNFSNSQVNLSFQNLKTKNDFSLYSVGLDNRVNTNKKELLFAMSYIFKF